MASTTSPSTAPDFSVVVPVFDEIGRRRRPLAREIAAAFAGPLVQR